MMSCECLRSCFIKGAIDNSEQLGLPVAGSCRFVFHSSLRQFLSIADIRNPYIMNAKKCQLYDRKTLPSHMHKLRQTHPTRQRIHKIPMPKLRRNPNQTRRQMPQIRQNLQMPQMRLHRTIKKANWHGKRSCNLQSISRRHR